jgi:hypothetical protein
MKNIISKLIPYILSWLSLGFIIFVLAKAIHHTIVKMT